MQGRVSTRALELDVLKSNDYKISILGKEAYVYEKNVGLLKYMHQLFVYICRGERKHKRFAT